MAEIICIANQKGGVGKTTIAINIGCILAKAKKKKVLFVDMDQQANLTAGLGQNPAECKTFYNILIRDIATDEAIINIDTNIDLIGSNAIVSDSEDLLIKRGDPYTALSESLNTVSNSYDYIIIDTPPSFDYIALNGIVASDYLLAVITPEFYSVQGLQTMYSIISGLNRKLKDKNREHYINGVIVNMYNGRRNLHKDTVTMLENKLPADSLIKPYLSNSVVVAEAPAYGEDILTYSKSSPAAKQFIKLTNSIIKRIKDK